MGDPVTEFAPGGVVDGRYELGRQLGAGGMARVYLAHDRLLDREVAVKVLAERYASDPAFVERFRREASAAAGLNHPNIVSVYDRGEADGSYYIVMEYLDGPDLKQVIRRRGHLTPAEAVDAALQILSALRAAHRRDVIHRDVKPQNVMVAEDGRLKVTDFGIARAGADSSMTEVGSVIGTAQYLSPEQARGEEVTAASDCYAVGIVLYEMLTGRVPFDGERPVAVAVKQINEPPLPPRTYNPEIPEELDAIVMRALAKRPAERYRTADEFAAALQEVRPSLGGGDPTTRVMAATGATRVMGAPGGGGGGTTRVQPRRPPPPDPPRRRPWVPILIGIIVLLAVAGAAVWYFAIRDSGPEQRAVPSVEGLSAQQAVNTLRSDGFVVQISRPTNDASKGTVLGTRPAAGDKADVGSAVTLLVSAGPATIPVPDVTGRTEDSARVALKEFQISRATANSDTVPAGNVISQDPAGGTQAAPGSPVKLTVSVGPEKVTVPDVRLGDLDTARQQLEARGLKVGNVTRQESSRTPGTVIAQNPGPTATVDKGSGVDLVIAQQPSQVRVPSVIGQDASAARSKLEGAGFTVSSEGGEPSNGEPAGQVIQQLPTPGSLVSPGTHITIIVSTGPTTTGGAQPPPPSGTSPGIQTSP